MGVSSSSLGLMCAIPPAVEAPSAPMVAHSHPIDQATLAILASQVQCLSASQSSSQQQMQSMYAAQQAVQQQMQSLLTHLKQPQGLHQPQSTLQPPQALAPPAPPPQLPSHSTIPQGPAPGPSSIQGIQQLPLGLSGPSGINVPPPPHLVPNHPSRSLASYFPDMKPMLLLVITKHELDPGQLFKSTPSSRIGPRMPTCNCQRQVFS